MAWFLSAHFPIWKIICLNLTSLLFQNEQTREILIWCSTFILYVHYVQSPILSYRDVCTLNEVRLSLLQADRYNKQVLDLLNFFLFRFKFVAQSKIKYLHCSRKSPGRLVRLTGFDYWNQQKPLLFNAFYIFFLHWGVIYPCRQSIFSATYIKSLSFKLQSQI